MIPPLRIVLSGGGIRAVAHAGALQALQEAGLLRAVKEYIGVSAGGLIAFSVVIGYSIETLRSFSEKFDFSEIRALDPETMFAFLETFGLDTASRLRKLLESLLKQKGLSPEITFTQFRAANPTAPRLRVFASDIYTCKPFEFSEITTPNSLLVDALVASMTIPGYFVPFREPTTGHMLVDGGALNNIPVAFLTPEEQKHTLSIGFSVDHIQVDKIETITDYFHQIYACFFLPRTLLTLKEHSERLIIIPCGEYPMWDFEATEESRKEMVEKGYQATRAFLYSQPKNQITRRFSVN
jgi:NTE family protein